MRDRLARHAEPVGQLVLTDALAGAQCAVGDRFQDPRIDLVDQVRERVERDHAGGSRKNEGIQNSVFEPTSEQREFQAVS
jgi:hypothetical protein